MQLKDSNKPKRLDPENVAHTYTLKDLCDTLAGIIQAEVVLTS